MQVRFASVGTRRRLLTAITVILGSLFAVTSQADSSAPIWDALVHVAPETGTTEFVLTASKSVPLTMQILELPTGKLLAEGASAAAPLKLSASSSEGVSYLVTWLASPGVEYSVTTRQAISDGAFVVIRGELDSTRASAPSYLETEFVPEVDGLITLVASWGGQSQMSLAIHDPETNSDVAKQVKVLGGKIELAAQLQGSKRYLIRVWVTDGAETFAVSAYNYKQDLASPVGAPNVLIINIDDARLDAMDVLPSVRKWFGDGGTTFRNGYVSTPSCCPSRATLMSGQLVHNHGVVGQEIPALNQDHTIQRYLSEAGYLTGHSGKFLHYFDLDQRGPHWDRWNYFEGGYYDLVVNRDGVVVEVDDYSTTLTFDRAIEFAQDFERFSDEKPWLLHVTPIAPHRPSQPEPRFAQSPVPHRGDVPSFFEADISDKPPFVQAPIAYGPDAANNERTQMLRTLMSLDSQVDRLMTRLEQMKELQNTLAIFTSDNGVMLGEHGLNEKFVPYREAIEVPFLIRWPGRVAAGSVDERLVGNLDIAPTVLAAVGITPVHVIDGIDILSGASRNHRFTEYFVDDVNGPRFPAWASVSNTSFTYTQYYGEDQSVVFREYYDLRKDPFELSNLYADGNLSNDPNDAALSELLEAHRFCAGSSCRPQ